MVRTVKSKNGGSEFHPPVSFIFGLPLPARANNGVLLISFRDTRLVSDDRFPMSVVQRRLECPGRISVRHLETVKALSADARSD
jgi:hypothetical protein